MCHEMNRYLVEQIILLIAVAKLHGDISVKSIKIKKNVKFSRLDDKSKYIK